MRVASGPDVRTTILDRLVEALKADPRVAGAVLVSELLFLFEAAVYRVREWRKALRRRRPWQAAVVLDELRELTLRIACLSRFQECRRAASKQRYVDDLPSELLDALTKTVVPVSLPTIKEALPRATEMMLAEARGLYGQAGEPFPEGFAAKLLAQLE